MIPDTAMVLRIAELRRKAREGVLTPEETKEGITFLRASRGAVTQATTGTKARASKAKAPIDSDALLDNF